MSFVYDRLLREAYVKYFSFTLIIISKVVMMGQVVDCFPLKDFNHVKILVHWSLIRVVSSVIWLLICEYLPCYFNMDTHSYITWTHLSYMHYSKRPTIHIITSRHNWGREAYPNCYTKLSWIYTFFLGALSSFMLILVARSNVFIIICIWR